MPRRPAFSFDTLYLHMRPSMTRAFPANGSVTAAMQNILDRLALPIDMSLTARLCALRQLVDEEAGHAQAAAHP